jgi:hypothetical protein
VKNNDRLLDDTDLNNIDNTFKLIEKTCESINARLNSMEKSNDIRYYTLLAVITVSSILLSILKVLF